MNDRYLAIPVSMVRDKNLTSMEMFIYIEISQLAMLEHGCVASNGHFAQLFDIKKEAVSRAISSLEKKGYINSKIKNGSRNFSRSITLNKMLFDPKQNVIPPLTKCSETKGTNTITNTDTKEIVATAPDTPPRKQKKKAMFTDEDMGLAVTMYHNILAMNEGYKKPDLEMWANEFRLMREIDKRTVEGMDNFLNSLATDDDRMWEFWRGNILSPKSMRNNYDKVVSQYRRDVVDKKKAVNQNIPIAERVQALSRMKKEA